MKAARDIAIKQHAEFMAEYLKLCPREMLHAYIEIPNYIKDKLDRRAINKAVVSWSRHESR